MSTMTGESEAMSAAGGVEVGLSLRIHGRVIVALCLATVGCSGASTTVAPPSLARLTLAPRNVLMPTNGQLHFLARVSRTDGSPAEVPISWMSLGGDVDQQGGYVSPEDPGQYRVIAIASYSSNLTDTAIVSVEVDTSVTAPPPTPPPPPPPPPGPLPPPSPGDLCSNEPSDMGWNNERSFDSKVENGWLDRGDPNFSIVADSTASRSPPRVGEAKYPAGFPAGRGPIAAYINLPANLRTLYVCYWIKVSGNWFGNLSGTNKVMFFQINGSRVFSALRGVGPNPLGMEIDFQGMGTHDETTLQRSISWNGWPNINGAAARLARGAWAKWEVLLIANTPGQYDGQAHWWINDAKVGQYTAIGFSSAAETGSMNTWSSVVWNPTYGGGGPSVPADQYMWMDHIYISGK